MKNNTLFALFCVASVGMNAFVGSVPVRPRPRKLSMRGIPSETLEKMVVTLKQLQADVPKTKEKDPSLRDWLADIIWAILGLTVGTFLDRVNNTIVQLNTLITAGVEQLNNLLAAADEATKQEIKEIIAKAEKDAIDIITPLLEQLSAVLPSLSSVGQQNFAPTDASDIIYAILGMTLEDLLFESKDILEKSDDLLSRTITDLQEIADRVMDTSMAEELHSISDEYLELGRAVIKPILSNLYEVLPTEDQQ